MGKDLTAEERAKLRAVIMTVWELLALASAYAQGNNTAREAAREAAAAAADRLVDEIKAVTEAR